MMDIALIIAALTFMITMYITPGPNNILCAFHGSKYGVKATIPLISGMALGWLIMGLFVAITLDIIERNKGVLESLTIVGALYIVYLSFKIATAKPLTDSEQDSNILGPGTGLTLQFVNGKAWIHDIVLLGSFGTAFGSGFSSKFILIILSIILCLPAILSWTAFGTILRRIFSTPKSARLLNRIMGISLFIVAIWLVIH